MNPGESDAEADVSTSGAATDRYPGLGLQQLVHDRLAHLQTPALNLMLPEGPNLHLFLMHLLSSGYCCSWLAIAQHFGKQNHAIPLDPDWNAAPVWHGVHLKQAGEEST